MIAHLNKGVGYGKNIKGCSNYYALFRNSFQLEDNLGNYILNSLFLTYAMIVYVSIFLGYHFGEWLGKHKP
jgi:hypothetical protein